MKKKSGFEKFYAEKRGSAKKEQFRQDKRKWKKELTEKAEAKRQSLKAGSGIPVQKVAISPSMPAPAFEQMPLNKYIAHCGVCSRREAVELIKAGKVKVNNEVMTEPGHKIQTKDSVTVSGKKIHPVKNLVYILLNKPKDYLTTTDDPQQRKTVLDLIQNATQERIYPV